MTDCAIESERKQHAKSNHTYMRTHTQVHRNFFRRERELRGCYFIAVYARKRESENARAREINIDIYQTKKKLSARKREREEKRGRGDIFK